MPEIKNRNIVEQTRGEIHKEDTIQIKEVYDSLQEHCIQQVEREKFNDKRNLQVDAKLDKLMPLADLIPSLTEIVENQKANVIVGRKVLKVVTIIGVVIGLVWSIIRVWKEIK